MEAISYLKAERPSSGEDLHRQVGAGCIDSRPPSSISSSADGSQWRSEKGTGQGVSILAHLRGSWRSRRDHSLVVACPASGAQAALNSSIAASKGRFQDRGRILTRWCGNPESRGVFPLQPSGWIQVFCPGSLDAASRPITLLATRTHDTFCPNAPVAKHSDYSDCRLDDAYGMRRSMREAGGSSSGGR